MLYGKALPPDKPIGESWEISDRAGDVSVVSNGPLAGKDLQYLMQHHQKELLGYERRGAVSPADQNSGCAGKTFVAGPPAAGGGGVAERRTKK